MVSVDSELLFDVAAAAITATAVLVFAFAVDLGGSPATEQALLVAFLGGVFAVTQRSEDRRRVLAGYGVVVVGALAVLTDAVNALSLGSTATVLGLLALAGALFGLRGRLDEDGRLVSGRTATRAFAVLAALAAAVVVVDVVTGGLAYELQPGSTVEVRGEPVATGTAGTLVADNPTPLPQSAEPPAYGACAAGNWSAHEFVPDGEERAPEPVRADARVYDRYDSYVPSFGQQRYAVEVRVDGVSVDRLTVPVEVADACPDDEEGDPYLVLYAVDDDSPQIPT